MDLLKKSFLLLERNFEKVFCSISLSIIAIALFIDVFFRYVLRHPLTGPQELVRFLFVWFVYLGASYAIRESAHIRLTHHLTRLPFVGQKIFRITADFLWLIYSTTIGILGIYLIKSMFRYPYKSQIFQLNLAYIYIIIPFSFILMSLRIIASIYKVSTNKIPPYSLEEERQQLD